jgi:pilus assembly protein CpaF
VTGSLIDRVRERLATESAPLRPMVVADAIRAESGGMLGDTELLSNLRVLQTELTGAGILEPLLCADGTTDVLVSAPDAVWVDDGNGLRRTDIQFADEAAVRRLAQRLALAAGRRLDDAQPWVDGQLTGLGAGGFAAGRRRRDLPVVAGASTGHPRFVGADRGGRHRADGRRTAR